MKKWIALLLIALLTCSCIACSNQTNGDQIETEHTEKLQAEATEEKIEIQNANELLTKVWDTYKRDASEEFLFPIVGGNVEAEILDMPARFDITVSEAQETMSVVYCIPAETLALTDDVATMMNFMRVNNFTAAALHITDTANAQTVVESIKATIQNNQWLGGNPDVHLMVLIDDSYVISAYGNEQIVELFQRAITKAYANKAVVVVEEKLAD